MDEPASGFLDRSQSISSRSGSLNGSQNQGKKAKRERRSKDDSFQRNYVCGCGKSYLSYAALYTHAKTKHDGVFPEGTMTLHKKKQGRPKKDEWSASRLSADYQKVFEFNAEFTAFLDSIGARLVGSESQKNLIENFPCEIFSRQSLYEKLLINVEQIRKELLECYGPSFYSQIDLVVFEINNGKRLNCNEVLALFLVFVFRFVSAEFYRELVFFVVALREMLNDFGWDKLREISDTGDKQDNTEFCESQNAEFVPDLANEFITEFWPLCLGTNRLVNDPKTLSFFGVEAVKLVRVISLVQLFCNWLGVNKFSKGRIELFQD